MDVHMWKSKVSSQVSVPTFNHLITGPCAQALGLDGRCLYLLSHLPRYLIHTHNAFGKNLQLLMYFYLYF